MRHFETEEKFWPDTNPDQDVKKYGDAATPPHTLTHAPMRTHAHTHTLTYTHTHTHTHSLTHAATPPLSHVERMVSKCKNNDFGFFGFFGRLQKNSSSNESLLLTVPNDSVFCIFTVKQILQAEL